MAIYHCSISNVSRAKGSSSCATLSYISADKVYEERTAQTYSYGRAERVLAVGTLIPENAPEEYRNPSVLFNSIENYEKAENARTAKKIEVALPREVDLAGQKQIVEDYIRENLTKEGYACTYAIHNDKKNTNPHAHILVVNRQINEKGEWNTKCRKEYALDEYGERIPQLDKDGNQKLGKRNEKLWKRINVQVNPLDKKEFLQKLREGWAVECNKYLEEEQKIDHRSYVAQGIEQIPTIHEGYASREIEKRGGVSERAEINREIRAKNQLLQQLIEQLKELGKKVKEKGEDLRGHIGELLQRSRSLRNGERTGTEPSGERTAPERAGKPEEQSAEDIIRELNAKERAAKERARASAAARADRDAERERLAAEERREALERSKLQTERSRGKGFSR